MMIIIHTLTSSSEENIRALKYLIFFFLRFRFLLGGSGVTKPTHGP